MDLINLYKDYTKIYTDASIVDSHTGIGLYVVNEQDSTLLFESIRLNNNISIYKAELHALLHGLKLAVQHWNDKKILLISDSLSSVKTIESNHSNTNYNALQEILQTSTKLTNRPTVIWVPSHVGIYGNECADKLARAATNRPNIDWLLPLQTTELNLHILKFIDRLHQQWWDEQKSTYHEFQPIVLRRPFFTANMRYRETTITRLLLGKAAVNHTLFIMKKHPTGLCDRCNKPETIKHLLLECSSPLSSAIRHILPSKTPTLVDIILNKSIQDIILQLNGRRI